MASDTKNVKIGVCQVFYNNIDLGYTKGGVEVTVATETHRVQVDQFGTSPISDNIMGRTVTVKVPLAETTLENLVAVMPGATLVTDKVDPKKKKVVVTAGIGVNLIDVAKELRLHPKGKPASDKSEDFVIPKAATPGGLTYAYMIDQERVFNCEFSGYPDTAQDDLLFIVGDDSAVKA